ncbi:MAG: hypothetical protein U5J83_18745 [Bryobacterales bacterium]|nr:hypothetical protein [Bryobacterales bacterium]
MYAAKQGLESVRYYSRLIEEEIAGISNRRRDLEGLAQAAAAGERDARANAGRAAERARATVKEMESAQALAAACNTAEGASRLGASLDNVRREFGTVLAELGNALRAAELHESSASGYDLWIPEYQLVLSRFPELKDRALQEVKAFAAAVDAIPGSAAKVDELKGVADTLGKDLAGAYEYYRKVNSSRAMEFERAAPARRQSEFPHHAIQEQPRTTEGRSRDGAGAGEWI